MTSTGWLDALLNDQKRQCPKCHEEFFPGECDIVATFPAQKRGEILYAAPKNSWLARKNPKPLTRAHMNYLATRQCPQCGYFLPRNIDTTPLLNIAIVGDFQAGKSHYIAALIKQLQEHLVVPDDQFFRFICMTSDVKSKYDQEYFAKLFEKKEEIDRTPPGAIIEPLIYELTFRQSIEHLPKTINIAIHDAAGGDFVAPERIVEFTRHVIHAKALIYLVNPAALPGIEKDLDPKIKRPNLRLSPSTTFNTIVKLIEEFNSLPAGAKLKDLPVAITLSKSDLLKKLRPASQPFAFSNNPAYTGGVDLHNLDQVEADVREVIDNFAGDRSLISVTQTIEKKRFLAISATGFAPEASGSFPRVDPCRCLDPFLWILHELGLVPEGRWR